MSEVNVFIRRYLNPINDILEVIYAERPYSTGIFNHRSRLNNLHTPSSIPLLQLAGECSVPDKEVNKKCSIRRSKKTLKFLILNNCTNNWRFLTLTYRGEGCLNRNTLFRDIEHFFEAIKKEVHGDLKYIAIVEFHKDKKRYHAHILCNLPYIRNEYIEEKYWKHGFVKLEKLKAKSEAHNLISVLKYMMKYTTKSIEENVEFKKRFSSSRNLEREPIKVSELWNSPEQLTRFIMERLKEGYRTEHYYKIDIENNVLEGFLLSASPFS